LAKQEINYVRQGSQIRGRCSREDVARCVEILNNAVKVTLGPKGRNVVLDKSFGAPRIMAKVRAVMTLNYRPQQLLQSRRPLNFKFGLMDSGALSRAAWA
jgi:hypothetical protein